MCARAGNALTGLCECAGLSEPSLLVQNPLEFIQKRGRGNLNESRLFALCSRRSPGLGYKQFVL